MAAASFESLRGYVLEELLARLLYDNGYRLLVSDQQDTEALKRGAHGLLVRGRGAYHQADVLGELTLPVPFSLPLRIFVEAKYRGQKAGLRDVRNAHGVVHDVNEQYATTSTGSQVRRYLYRYTLFSASGFSKPAQQYALAQQISLVDLSSPAFTAILNAADHTARELFDLASELRVSPFPYGQVRTALRLALGTWTASTQQGSDELAEVGSFEDRGREASSLNPAKREPAQLPPVPLARIASRLGREPTGDLLIGFPRAPFVLALRPDDPDSLADYAARHGSDIRVNIEFATRRDATRRDVTGDWAIVPADGSRRFSLLFALPDLLEDWLLGGEGAVAMRARDLKADLLSSIAVFHNGKLIRLLFEPRRSG